MTSSTVYFQLAALVVCGVSFCNGVIESTKCCSDGDPILFQERCSTNTNISIICENGHNILLNNDWSEYSRFQIGADSKGEYLEAYGSGYIVRPPHYCVGSMKSFYTGKVYEDVAIVCSTSRIMYQNLMDEDIEASPLADIVLEIAITLFNGLSTLALASTALVYGTVRDLHQDSQGVCTFHFSLCLAAMHGSIFYKITLGTAGLLPDLCITKLYFHIYIGLSSFTWCAILGYNLWIRITNENTTNEQQQLLTRYKLIGYGFPAAMVAICNISAHATKLYTQFSLEDDCRGHQGKVLLLAVVVPIMIFNLTNCFFYIDMQKKLWNSPELEMRCEKSTLKMMKYRLIMNGKLFFIMGIPWLLFISFSILYIEFYYPSFLLQCMNAAVFLISIEGVLIFFVLVVRRKKVLKAVSRTYGKRCTAIPEQWRTIIDSETDDDGDFNNPQAVEFTKRNSDGVDDELTTKVDLTSS